MTTYEIQPLPALDLAWAVAIDDEAATLVEVARYKHAGKLIDAFDHFSLQLWKRSPDDVLVVRDSGQKEQPVVELSDFQSKRREATLHVRSRTGDGHQNHHKFTVFLFDALCGGSSAYWSTTQILGSLGIKNPSCYLRQTQKSYEQARLQYELNDLETTGRGDAAMLETKAVCTEMFILLLARWSFRYKKTGGLSNEEARSSCEALLRTLCKAIHTGQTIKMPFCLHRGVKRHECGAIVGKDVVFISVRQDGIVDLSELRAQSQRSKSTR